jgi:hypothetical protein
MVHTLLRNAVVAFDVIAPARFTGWLLPRTLGLPLTTTTAGNILAVSDLFLFHDG